MTTPARATLALALALPLLAAPFVARPADVEITWDRDLAQEWDRASYEKTLREFVEEGLEESAGWLGITPSRPIKLNVLTRARYEAQFGSDAAWSQGAHYQNGAIQTNGGARLNGSFAGLLAHELAHALLDHRGTGGRLPQWLNEGIAERIGWRRRGVEQLDGVQVNQLESALDQRTLLPLPRGGRLSAFGYLQSFAAVLFLESKLGTDRLLAVVRRTVDKDSFERALEAEGSMTLRQVDEGFTYWVDHLQ
jgi:hypothetical protein